MAVAWAEIWARSEQKSERKESRSRQKKAPSEQVKSDVSAAYAPPSRDNEEGLPELETLSAGRAALSQDVKLSAGEKQQWLVRARSLVLKSLPPTLLLYVVLFWPHWPIVRSAGPLFRTSDGFVVDNGPELMGYVGMLCLFAANLLDIVRELGFRRAHPDAVVLRVESRLYVADAVLSALSEAGIVAFARSSGVRTLLPFFGSFAPIEILVPASLAKRAEKHLRGPAKKARKAPRKRSLGDGGAAEQDLDAP